MPAADDEKMVLFDHWNYVDPDDLKEPICEALGCDVSEWDDIPDDDKWRELAEIEELDYESEKANIQAAIGDRRILCVGSAQCWNGTFAGGFIADDLQGAIDEMRGRDYGDVGFYIDGEDGELHMTFTHHDGTNNAVLRALTDAGSELVYENEYDYDSPMGDRELHERLMTEPGLSEKIAV